ncbi:GlxA family transcriptional regulator [Polyangium sp. y55x31]|uniref:GlxA family transcriptional regulator n=1 Tax=Polyangium sp. y55x31 TaxID=3042688 RepID=UPI0024831551|nr:GlxA family transcriptional regulator [Polyangium sp. y55x31]MDI1484533.1 GlxA family transcriptional regulator [Polyangium sp. y55x31]
MQRRLRTKKSAPRMALGKPQNAAPRKIVLVIYDGVAAIDFVGPLDVFAFASEVATKKRLGAPPAYVVELASACGRPVRSWSGMQIVPNHALEDLPPDLDTVLVSGGDYHRAAADARLLAWLRARTPEVRRMGAVCSGAFILAAAGLLRGHRATTHWAGATRLAREYPDIEVEPDAIFVRSGKMYTSAGGSAGMDLALALVEDDLGHDVALSVARSLVLFLKRPGGQSQFSRPLLAQTAAAGPLQGLVEWLVRHLDADLRVEVLAKKAGMSARNFARTFTQSMQMTPAKFVEAARLEVARSCLEGGRASLKQIARECGFGTEERMRRAFQRNLRVTPEAYRRRFARS